MGDSNVSWLIEQQASVEWLTKRASGFRGMVNGPPTKGTENCFYALKDHETRAERNPIVRAINGTTGVDRLRLWCDANGEKWSAATLRKLRSWAVLSGSTSDDIDSLAVSDFAEWAIHHGKNPLSPAVAAQAGGGMSSGCQSDQSSGVADPLDNVTHQAAGIYKGIEKLCDTDNEFCYFSRLAIANKARVSVKTVSRYINDELKPEGLVEVGPGGKGFRVTNRNTERDTN